MYELPRSVEQGQLRYDEVERDDGLLLNGIEIVVDIAHQVEEKLRPEIQERGDANRRVGVEEHRQQIGERRHDGERPELKVDELAKQQRGDSSSRRPKTDQEDDHKEPVTKRTGEENAYELAKQKVPTAHGFSEEGIERPVFEFARQLPNEFEKRTLYPLLAKPVSRTEFLMGKIFAVVSISALTMIVLVSICWISTPKSPAQHPLAFAQMIGLQIVGLSLLGLLSMTISLFCPAVVAGLLALVLYFLGTSIVNGLSAIATKLLGESGNLLGAALSVVPDFSAFNHVDRYVSGQAPMSAESFLAIVAYGALSFGFYAIVAAWSFERKAI